MIANGKTNVASVAETWDAIRADYDMSRQSRFIRRRTGLAPEGNSADYHYRTERFYYDDIEKARDMDRNDAIVGQTVDRAVDNIVQQGFTYDPKTGDKKLDADLKAWWSEESENATAIDIAEESTFHDFEWHSARAMLADGDCVNLGVDEGQLQHLEAHTIQTSTRMDNTFLGVTKNTFGKRVRYWVQTDPIEPNRGRKENATYKDVRNEDGIRQLFHVYNTKRMSQTRGVTAFAPIFATAGMFEDIQFAKMVQEQIISCFAIFRQRADVQTAPHEAQGYGNPETETTSAGETRYIENIAPGMEIIGEPGEELKGFSPDVPNSEYFNHAKLMLQIIGVNLGLPLCLVLMDGSETNFSGWRGAVDEARKGFKRNQRALRDRFHKPYMRWRLSLKLQTDPAMQRANEKARVNVFKHDWQCPRWQYIQPKDDAQADILRIQGGLTSPRRLHAERGADWDEVKTEIISDNSMAIAEAVKAAEKINAKHGTSIHWRELISLPMPNGVQMALDPGTSEEADDDE